MPQPLGGNAKLITATGTVAVTSAAARIMGVLFHGTGTGLLDGIWSCQGSASGTATNAIGGKLIAYVTVGGVTVNQSIYFDYPADAPNGIVLEVGAAADPKVTLFWTAA